MNRLILPFALFVFCLLSPACAQVITVDPNTPSAAASREEPEDFWADPRLAQPVTYEALRKPVREILDDLTDLTAVKLNPGYNANDWQVRDRLMVIFAKDLPLKELMQSIARVMKFQWSRAEKDGVWTYRLWMDRKTLLGEEAQRAREEKREEEYISKQRERLLDLMDKSSQFTQEELVEMKESDPYSYALVKSGVGAAMGDLMRETPEVRQTLRRGQELQISGENMTAEARSALVRLAKASGKLEFYQGRSESDPNLDDALQHPEKISVRFNDISERLKPGEPLRRSIFGDVCISVYREPDSEGVIRGSDSCRMGILNPDSGLAKAYGSIANRVIDGEMSADTARQELYARESQIVAAERTDSDWGEPLAEHLEDPDLERVVKFELPKGEYPDGTEFERKSCEDVFRALVKATGMSVVSDFFYYALDFFPTLGPWESESRIIDAFTFLEQNYLVNWWRHGSVLELRDRYWFRKRGMQIPDAWIERWAEECDRKGVIEIDSLAQICSLTEEQFRYNFQYDKQWPYDFFIRGLNVAYEDEYGGPVMRFYASLDKYQRGALLQGGLDARTLNAAQWDKLVLQPGSVAMLTAQRSDTRKPYIDENGEEIGITGEIGYTFSGFGEDGSVAWDQRVGLPVKWERKKTVVSGN